MKNLMMTFAFLFVAFYGFSQNTSADKKAKAVEIIQLNSGAQFEVMIKPLASSIPESNREAFKAEVRKSLQGLYEQLAEIYLDSFSEEDLDAMLEFYNSPVGQKMVEETPKITEESMQLGQTWGMQLQPIMAKYQD